MSLFFEKLEGRVALSTLNCLGVGVRKNDKNIVFDANQNIEYAIPEINAPANITPIAPTTKNTATVASNESVISPIFTMYYSPDGKMYCLVSGYNQAISIN